MLEISVKVSGLELVLGRPEVRAALRQSIRRAGQIIKVRAEASARRFFRQGTGNPGRFGRNVPPLSRSLRVRVRERGDEFAVTVKSITFYGHILEVGAAAHRIPGPLTRRERREGVQQKVLRFQAGGKVIFARSVLHPGVRRRPWFASAVQAAVPDLQQIFEQELGAAVDKRPLIIPGAA